jgi:hypothetical protein
MSERLRITLKIAHLSGKIHSFTDFVLFDYVHLPYLCTKKIKKQENEKKF